MAETVTSLAATVANLLKNDGAKAIEEKVATELFDREVSKRAEAIVKVLDLIAQEKKSLQKVNRPDNTLYDANRKVVSESYSKTRLDEIDKITNKIKKLEGAINKSLEKDDHGDLYQAASGKLSNESSGENKSTGGSEGES